MTEPAVADPASPDPAPRGASANTPAGEQLRRVLDAVLREDILGLRSTAETLHRPDGIWLRLNAPNGATSWLIPVRPDGFQCEYAAREPLLLAERDGTRLTTTDAVLATLRDLADPRDRSGFDDFAEECRQSARAGRVMADALPAVRARLAADHGPDPSTWTGLRAGPALDTLAAHLDHPIHPTPRARSGLDQAALRRYAPEHHPTFRLRWALLPHDAATLTGTLPDWWPTPTTLGRPDLEHSRLALPVHPLTLDRLPDPAVPTAPAHLDVRPTLSMRTVAVLDHPGVHLKLPLPIATLGMRNRRTIKPGTLVDGAAGQRLLAAVLDHEPRLRERVLLADEQTHLHAGHELLAVLVRRYPNLPDDALVLPVAALLARVHDGTSVLDRVAERWYGGDRFALLDAYLTLLLDWQTTLFRYGVALESHPQNLSLVLADDRPVRLLLKDNDGPRINRARCPVEHDGFDDPRTYSPDDGPLADLFVTITVHLCAGALAFALSDPERAELLHLVRDRLADLADPWLRRRILDADRLPIKAMVTAGTLLTKERSGAADINKHYTTGPNYLRPPAETP